jgi:putative DNA primase/helicase
MLKIKDFNELLNPDNKALYIPLHNKKPNKVIVPHSFDEIVQLAMTDPELEIGAYIPQGFIVINIDNKIESQKVLEIIKDRKEKLYVIETPNGLHIYARSNITYNTKNNILNIGVNASVLAQDIGRTYVVTPFKHPKVNKNSRLDGYKEVYFNGIDWLPLWLLPIYNSNSIQPRKTTIPIPLNGNNENVLIEHLQTLKFTRLNAGERSEIIEMINRYISVHPLSETELNDKIFSEYNEDTLPASTFFDKDSFQHHRMGDYMIEYVNAKKDEISHKLYFYNDRLKRYDSNEEYLKGIITKLVPTLKDNQKNEVIKHMESKLSLSSVRFNQEPYQINFKNGVLDLLDMKLYPHSPDFYDTIQLNVSYVKHDSHPVADKFFKDATQGNKETQQLLYEAIGYSFLKTANLEKIFMLTGAGRNGKSTFLNIVRNLVGLENATSIDFKEMNKDFGTGGLANKLVSVAGDISNQRIDDSDMIKKLASGDLLRINEKYEKKYDIVPFTTFFLSANKLPQTPDTTYAFYRRFCIIPFNADLSAVSKVQGAKFQKELMSESSKEYIAYKAMQAIWSVLNTTEEFTEPEEVTQMLEQYRIENSSVLKFMYDKHLAPSDFDPNTYVQYGIWCEYNGHRKKAFGNFINDLESEWKMKYDSEKIKFK